MGQFTTKGDANAKADVNPVEYEDFIGEMVLSIPYLGQAAQLFTSSQGKAGAGIVIVLALVLHGIGSLVGNAQRKKK